MSGRGEKDLLSYYQAELSDLREAGVEFAREHPGVARRLELERDESPDPHVERLIESFAYLTARIQQQLDDEFPDAAAALLGVLYPHYTAPTPSTTVARFRVLEGQGKLTTGHGIRRGTPLVAHAPDGLLCRFRTCYPVTLWPVTVESAAIESADRVAAPRGTQSILRIRMRGWGESPPRPDSLCFYLGHELRSGAALYELLFAQATGVYVRSGETGALIPLPADSLRPVGFRRDEAMLYAPEHAHPAYRLLQEYFVNPHKFLFAEFTNLKAFVPPGPEWELIVPLRRPAPEWLRVSRDSFQLGCTPIINLFDRLTEPIRVDQRRSEYRLVPDVRRTTTTEVHTILKVSASSDPKNEAATYQPLYSFSHGNPARAYWNARRVPTPSRSVAGTDVLLSFVDLDFNPAFPSERTVWAHTLCTNRNLAEQLPPGQFLEIEESAPLHGIDVLHTPTLQRDPPMAGATLWRLVSQLSLNHLSLEGPAGLRTLQEMLRLYNAAYGSPGSEQQASGVTGIECRRVVRRAGHGEWRGMCRGTEITLTFDETCFAGTRAFLLASVLRHFLGLYAPINSFTQTIARGPEAGEEWKAWPPLTGEQSVL
ncbi:MAG TPA: type VI secretion system baseplate subunit TssF [Longimicrobium sp.]